VRVMREGEGSPRHIRLFVPAPFPARKPCELSIPCNFCV
jgi:hypothetical protein